MAWVNEYLLKGQDIWSVSASSSGSWGWNKLLSLGSVALDMMTNVNGSMQWIFKGNNFSVEEVWNKIRPRIARVAWSKLVWNFCAIPKHSFISWMAILGRLPTRDRLRCWGLQIVEECLLCGLEPESIEHIFGTCSFSKPIWWRILQSCGIQRTLGTWQEDFSWIIRKSKGKSLQAQILKCAWNAYIYQVWFERNSRLHGKSIRSVDSIFEDIKFTVKVKIAGQQIARREAVDTNSTLVENWFIC